jgi:hypothetical protein
MKKTTTTTKNATPKLFFTILKNVDFDRGVHWCW